MFGLWLHTIELYLCKAVSVVMESIVCRDERLTAWECCAMLMSIYDSLLLSLSLSILSPLSFSPTHTPQRTLERCHACKRRIQDRVSELIN